VPAAVANEISRRGVNDPIVQAMREASWLTVVEDPAISDGPARYRRRSG
jgi:hypothetical protein